MPILGMERIADDAVRRGIDYVIANTTPGSGQGERPGPRSTSRSHGGFDNDVPTMNDILQRILGEPEPARRFTAWDLDYG